MRGDLIITGSIISVIGMIFSLLSAYLALLLALIGAALLWIGILSSQKKQRIRYKIS